jgi:hypothetical protein
VSRGIRSRAAHGVDRTRPSDDSSVRASHSPRRSCGKLCCRLRMAVLGSRARKVLREIPQRCRVFATRWPNGAERPRAAPPKLRETCDCRDDDGRRARRRREGRVDDPR